MAWLKAIPHEATGAEASYWEVISINYNHRTQLSEMAVGGWYSEETYEENKEPVMIKVYVIPAGLAPELAAGALAFVTNYVKNQPEFEGWE